MCVSKAFLIILTYAHHLSSAQTIGVLETLTFDEITTEQIDAYTARQIGWIKMYSCIQQPASYTYYHTAELSKLQYYAISIKFVPPGSKTNANYDDYAVVAKPCSNPVRALNHAKEVSFVINEGTVAYLEQANTDFWIGTATAKARLTNTCNNPPLRDFSSYIYHACGNTDGLHVNPSSNQCSWDYQTVLPQDMEIYFGFDINKQQYCNTPYRQIINFDTNNCVNDNSRPPTYDPALFRFATCDETNDNQLWQLADIGAYFTTEWFRLKNKKSTCCMEITTTAYQEYPDGTLWGCNACKDVNIDSQYFKIDDNNGNSFRLRNKQTDICFYQALNGRFGVIPCSGFADQRWNWKIISNSPTASPTNEPTWLPTTQPTSQPTTDPSKSPSETPSKTPSKTPSVTPSKTPSKNPSETPSKTPSKTPSVTPSETPSETPSNVPTKIPTKSTTTTTTGTPIENPTIYPTIYPTTEDGKSVQKDTSKGIDKLILILILLIVVVLMCIICMIFVYFYYGNKKKSSNESNIARAKENEAEGHEIELGVTSPTSVSTDFANTNHHQMLSVVSNSSDFRGSLSEEKHAQVDNSEMKANNTDLVNNQMNGLANFQYANGNGNGNGNVMNNQMMNPMMSMPNLYGNMGGMGNMMNANYGMDQNFSMANMNAMAMQMTMMQQNFGINNNMAQFYMNQMETNTTEPGGEPRSEAQNVNQHVHSMPNMPVLPPEPGHAQNQ